MPKVLIEIDLPAEAESLDCETLGAISRVLEKASDLFDIGYDEQEFGGPYEIKGHELLWRWKVT